MRKSLWVRIMALAMLCLSLAVPGFCVQMPTIEYEEFQLGNIKPGTQLTAVNVEYGQPVSQDKFLHYSYGKKLKGIAYTYSNGMSVFTLPTKRKHVSTIIGVTTTSAALATPSGFAVGKPFSMVTGKYGTVLADIPESLEAAGDRAAVSQGYNFYEYTYGPSVMRFKVDKSNIIREIKFTMGA
ncbi:MAG: hypothetical protein LKF34_02070 [Acidaminococcaceae bacterium]|nr:hypothetical protein [Acidaminococcaceae bacterium]